MEGFERADEVGPSPDGSPAADVTSVELARLTLYADTQERKVNDLQATVAHLRHALTARVVIDRAVGMLAERFDLQIADAFELLRAAARDSRREVRALAEELNESRGATPKEIVAARRRRRT
jgi:ANTAR domain